MRFQTREMSVNRKIGLFVITSVFLMIIYSLSRNLLDLLSLGGRVESAQAEVEEMRVENQRLQILAAEIKSGSRDEEYIRNSLGLVRPGETVVIIPEDYIEAREEVMRVENEEDATDWPVWRQWAELFF
jgi:cell division protein FtsB